MLIRAAAPDDVEAVLALWRTADAAPTRTDSAEGLRTLLARDPDALLVAIDIDGDGDALVGSIIAGWDGWRGSIYRLAVAPSHRRRGVGRRLVAEAETRLADLGARRLQATVVATEDTAVAFWTGVGWERQEERLRFVRD
jgi:ribosomal protein S18 acetylase RimI-like enzyme